ncbi:midasin [Marchantia polymorpha subsp. ruderalis]|uniref:Midasin n=2 Tax=Marchantia polymorpha TaxID=3197 RepID=A0AAF6AQT0_MARPO|nr:hypothetical protein MARPO_0033s0024 [Marchantia polymorpha]BBM98800.1 hypothetical protein Mp_1g16360 [Marchantia polymorpha subsp. ruderalis]|eukprot:PTQ41603.1 hypothetical protein MARPO_0033s0024 [Marchantia polymorpha]
MQEARNLDWRAALDRLVARQPNITNDSLVRRILHEGFDEEGDVFAAAQQLLLRPQLTVATAGCFRPLLSRLIDSLVQSLRQLWLQGRSSPAVKMSSTTSQATENSPFSTWSLSVHEHAVMALSRILELAPYTLSMLLQYFAFAPPPFERLLQGTTSLAEDVPPLLDVVRACYRFLQLEPKVFRDLWDWSPFLDLLQWAGTDALEGPSKQMCLDIRWCAAQILSIVLRMSDGATRLMTLKVSGLTEEDCFACLLRWEAFGHEIAVEKAGMYLEQYVKSDISLSEGSQNEEVKKRNGLAVMDEFQSVVKRTSEVGASFVEICGIELPVRLDSSSSSSACPSTSSFVLTSTVKKNLESVVLALSQRQPILLEGPIGAGKTLLIQELADLTGNSDVVFVHLDDQMDSKTLLGNYVCTEIPGEFKWQPGALTQAVLRGLWVVFEDIDRAPLEILSALVPLLEDRKLYLAGRGEVINAAENFCLFSTVTRTKFGSASVGGKDMLTNLWRKVVIDSPSDDELAVIIEARFPMISVLIPKLIGTLNMVREMTSQSSVLTDGLGAISVHIGRQFSTRDLVKWCQRIVIIGSQHFEGQFLSTYARERIFVEAIDCFAGSISSIADRQLVMRAIAEHWEVPLERVNFFSTLNKPSLQVSRSAVQLGRATITSSTHKGKSQGGRPFAHTGQAMRTLESIGACVQQKEPVLLVGETGTGKTTIVQYLARQISMPLVVLNLSQQSDSVDLLGGYKPLEAQNVCIPLFESFNILFRETFPMKKNADLLEQVGRLAERKRWEKLLKAFRTTVGTVSKLAGLSFPAPDDDLRCTSAIVSEDSSDVVDMEQLPKRKRPLKDRILNGWRKFSAQLYKAERQVESAKTAFAFSFVEGALVRALKEGHWILLDEINLAPTETLERLTGVLEGEKGSLCLTERGDVESIMWHPDFRIFACMNPATDVGKRDLPLSLKNRLTEFFVDELTNKEDLHTFVYQYLETALPNPPVEDIVNFYLLARQEAESRLLDGANQKPQYSLRSLARALEYTKAAMSIYGFHRSMYDGLCMSFLTLLDRPSALIMDQLILRSVFKQTGIAGAKWLKSLLKIPVQPSSQHVLFEQFWVEKGNVEPSELSFESCQKYVLTPSIREHLKNLARAVFVRKNPVLLQGPTSSGKTSMIEYLALTTGHRFVRINNHEHTDLQEYLGSYVTDNFGKLVFQEGILVEAVRKGYWIVLDELNLAPSDVLEALNRLLDDNRELFVPELQLMVKPHPHFMLFATQNPPGIYGGRKILSRAFRNRFIELHVDDIPDDELQVILEKRCQIPGSYASKMVEVMKDLQRHRQSSRVFAGKHGFITPRDLFRWADRHANGYQELARDGYMLLAERLRDPDEKLVVQLTLEKHMRVKIELEELHELSGSGRLKEVSDYLSLPEHFPTFGKIVWTKSMKRLFNLVEHCIRHSEPILLVGDTGCGKTTVCQMLALFLRQKLHILNCHQHSETADFIGGLRPVRERDNLAARFQAVLQNLRSSNLFQKVYNDELSSSIEDSATTLGTIRSILFQLKTPSNSVKDQSKFINEAEEIVALESMENELTRLQREWQSLFLWHDGPLVEAMRNGDFFLIDEISLADDSVLERLNSVLEPKRLLVLAEKGGSTVEEIVAHAKFRLLATMNPGGDFGKRELSPALRNRFTEIWVPPICDVEDLRSIVTDRFAQPELLSLTEPLLHFWQWFQNHGDQGRVLSVRDLLSWVSFINCTAQGVGLSAAFVHGALLVLLDGLGLGTGLSSTATEKLRGKCLDHLLQELPDNERSALIASSHFEGINSRSDVRRSIEHEVRPMEIETSADSSQKINLFGIHPFFIPKGTQGHQHVTFELSAPTTSWNALRILRAMQLSKPVLLEGSPGVGKTSLVTALARSSGHALVRINLSEQTDVMDLFGSDMPVEGGKSGEFEWSDGVFLQALKAGHWILLDELNLASQSVLEGLNACLDHRGEVFIPELGLVFKCPPNFRVFACQNPISQGGGRKGLPKSFLNRFTKVYVDALQENDYLFIARALHPSIPEGLLEKMVRFNGRVYEDTMVAHAYGHSGSPWEFNLRDILRWCELVEGMDKRWSHEALVESFLDVVYLQRMRTKDDRHHVLSVYKDVFGVSALIDTYPLFRVSPEHLQVGKAVLPRKSDTQIQKDNFSQLRLLPGIGNRIESLLHCVKRGWMCNLVGPAASGKTNLVRLLAAVTGNTLHEFALSSGTDTTELLGCFEQYDPFRRWQDIVRRAHHSLEAICCYCLTVSENTLSVERKLMLVKSLMSSWAAFQKCLSSRGRLPAFTLLNEEKDVLDPLSVEMLLQTLEQLIQTCRACNIQSLSAGLQPHQLAGSLKAVQECVGKVQKLGRFEWNDGGLLKAIENGNWVLLENANLCNPTVLDRLNPLLEPDGTIMINERGLVNGEAMLVRAHPDFRLFITVDPIYGEVSRAMRNRGVEIFMMESDWYFPEPKEPSSLSRLNDLASESAYKLLVQSGIPGNILIEGMYKAHLDIKMYTKSLPGGTHVSLRTLSHWISLLHQLLERGANFTWSLACSWVQTFVRHLENAPAREAALHMFHSRISKLDLGGSHQELSLFVPGGWPSPHNLSLYCMRSKESNVKVDSMYVEQLISEYILMQSAKNGRSNLQRSSGGISCSSIASKVDIFTYLSPRLLYRILNPSTRMDGDTRTNFDDQNLFRDIEAKLHYASLWMIEHGSLSDMGLRILWLNSFAAKIEGFDRIFLPLVVALEKELQHAIGKELLLAWERLESQIGGDFFYNVIPYTSGSKALTPRFQNEGNSELSKDAVSQVMFLGKKLLSLRRSLLQWHIEDETYKSVPTQAWGSLQSPILQSYWHSVHGSTRKAGMVSNIPKTMVKYLFPFFTSMRNFENEILTRSGSEVWFLSVESLVSKLQEWHEDLWKILIQPTFVRELFLFYWLETKQTLIQVIRLAVGIPDIEKIAESLEDIVRSLDEGFSFGPGSGFRPLLWKYGGHPQMLSSKELYEQERSVLALCQKVWESPEQGHADCTSSSNIELRRVIMEGLSMSVWLRQKKFNKREDQVVGSIGTQTALNSAERMHEARRECGQIFQMVLEKINSEILLADNTPKDVVVPLNITAIFGQDARPSKLSCCKCASGHRSDDTMLQDLMYLPSVQSMWLELLPWLDHVSIQMDMALLGNVSATSLAALLDCNLHEALKQGGLDSKFVHSVLEFAITSSSRSPVDFVPHQQIIWILEALDTKSTDLIVSLQYISHEMWVRWHQALWRTSSKQIGESGEEWTLTRGPPRMFQAAQSVLLSSRIGRQPVPVQEYRGKLLQLRRVISHLWNLQKKELPDSRNLDLCNLSTLFQQILLVHKKSFVPNDYDQMRKLLTTFHEHILKKNLEDHEGGNKLLEDLESILQRSKHQGLLCITRSLVIPCAQLLYCTSWANCDAREVLVEHGRLWLLVGSIRLRLILPLDECDPVTKYGYKCDHIRNQLHNLNLEIEVRHKSEVYSRGSGRTQEITSLQLRADELAQEMNNLSLKIIFRPQPSKFKDFCQEVKRFIDLSAGTERLSTLWSKLSSPTLDGARCIPEAVAFQENCERFLHHLDGDYPAYRDFVQPVKQAVYELAFGLSLGLAAHLQRETMISVGVQHGDITIANLICVLLEFPRLKSRRKESPDECSTAVEILSSYDLVNSVTEQVVDWAAAKQNVSSVSREVAKMESRVGILRIALLRFGHEVLQSGITTKTVLERLEMCFNAFSSLWREIREHRMERQRREAQLSQFTTTTYNMDVEETLDEESFKTMFPDYKPEFESFKDLQFASAEDDDRRAQESVTLPPDEDCSYAEKSWTRMEEALVKDVTRIHNLLFNARKVVPHEGNMPVESFEEEIVQNFVLSYDTGKQLLESLGHCVPASVDKRLFSSHLMRYNVEYHKLAGGRDGLRPTTNKLSDTNASEIALLLDPVANYLHRIQELLVEWPDHPVLLQLLQIASTILSFPLDTPVMKALTGVELLLAKSQLWEENAAKHVSVAGELSGLSRLVTHWRKMELEEWSSLLKSAEENHIISANKLWFSLYGLLHRPVGDDINAHLEATTSSMEEFMQSATLGEFGTRLQLVEAFQGHISVQLLARAPVVGSSRVTLEALSNLLHNLLKYYSQFLPTLNEIVSSDKLTIETELKDFVRLSKWDDRSYYTLSLSSEKTHRKLHKLVKKYDEVLKRPASELVAKQASRMGAQNLSSMNSHVKNDVGVVLDIPHEGSQEMKTLGKKSRRKGIKKKSESIAIGLSADEWRKRCETKLKQLAVVAAQVPTAFTEAGGYRNRLPALCSKIGSLLGASVFFESSNFTRQEGADSLEMLATSIIVRSTELREGEKKIAIKKKALIDLLKILRQIGMSHHKSAVPKEQRSTQSWLLLRRAEVGSMSYHHRSPHGVSGELIESSETKLEETCIIVWDKASDYYFKNMALLQHLQASSLEFNKDLTLREVDLCKRYMEHILYIQQCQRVKAHNLSLKLGDLGQLTEVLSSCGCSDTGLPKQKIVRKWLWQQKFFFDSLWQVATETLLLLKTSERVHICPENLMRLEVYAMKLFVEELLEGLKPCKDRLDNHLLPRSGVDMERKETFPIFITSAVYEDLTGNFNFVAGIEATFKKVFQQQKTLGMNQLTGLQPLKQLLDEGYAMVQEFSQEEIQTSSTAHDSPSPYELLTELSSSAEHAISEILLAVQTLSRPDTGSFDEQSNLENNEESFNDAIGALGRIDDFETATLEQTITARLDRVTQALLQVLVLSEKLVDHPSAGKEISANVGRLLNCIHVPLDMLHIAGMHLLFNYISLHKSVTKLGYILGNLFLSLFTEGFCRTKDGEGEDGANNFEDDAKGTGMGEGEGKKDVSEQIEDEEQLMGDSDKDKDAEKEEGGKKPDKGVEMEQDFNGEMMDLSSDESEDDDDTEKDENEQLESKMGEDGEDNEIVDEKLWNDEDESGDRPEGKEKYEKDSGVTGAKPEDLEMRGKEGTDEDDTGKGENSEPISESEVKPDEDEPEVEPVEDDVQGANKDETLEDSSGVKPSMEETLELPDNLELDGEEDGKDEEGEPDDPKGADGVENEVTGDTSLPEAMDIDDDIHGEQNEVEPGDDEGAEEEGAEEENLPSNAEVEKDSELLDDPKGEDSDRTQEEMHVDRTSQDEPNEPQAPSGEDPRDPQNMDARTSNNFSETSNIIAGMKGNTSQLHGEENNLEETGMTEASRHDKTEGGVEKSSLETVDGADRMASRSDPSTASEGHNPEKPDINPYRSLGDALKQWKERIKVADSNEQSGELENKSVAVEEDVADGDDAATEYEFITKEDDPSKAQALGSATKEQLDDSIAQSGLMEENASDDVMQEQEAVDTSQQVDEEYENIDKSQILANTKKSRLNNVKEEGKEQGDTHLQDDIEKDIGLLDLEDAPVPNSSLDDSLVSLQVNGSEASRVIQLVNKDEFWSEDEISRVRKELEVGLKETAGNIEAAREIWQKYEHLTARLSQELAEQLRLILEPTLATKLQGDYRSGKRINMKKIIPYIASQFRKDKIWLRRSKANKRQYQVVLAIDDSRSMSESHCGHMALEALITICRAMSQVEIGQMAVASFGEKGNVHLLHDFDQTFSSEAGVNMVSRFSFSQDNTIADEPMVDLLHFLTRMLDIAARNAATPSGNLNLQQLVLIIADGRFHEKESLRRCIREATSRKQLLAFIVLDNPQESILDMQSVSFGNGAPSFTKYLDSFPFPYYILLRDIESLPKTLADLLRQWFELTQRFG